MIIDSDFLESYLGLRVESVDGVEIIRRMEKGIYNEAEMQKALKWAKEKCIIGFDKNPAQMELICLLPRLCAPSSFFTILFMVATS